MNILEFSEKIINGVGGLHDFEYYEMASPNYDRDVSVAIWVIKCLANPKCEGSEEAVQAIIERRNKLAAEHGLALDGGKAPANLADSDIEVLSVKPRYSRRRK